MAIEGRQNVGLGHIHAFLLIELKTQQAGSKGFVPLCVFSFRIQAVIGAFTGEDLGDKGGTIKWGD